MIYNTLSLLIIISYISTGIGWLLSMRQYFRIKSYKNSIKNMNIILEHTINGPKYMFDSDFIEYFPIAIILKQFDSFAYNNYSDELKKLYSDKHKYEIVFIMSIIMIFVFTFIIT